MHPERNHNHIPVALWDPRVGSLTDSSIEGRRTCQRTSCWCTLGSRRCSRRSFVRCLRQQCRNRLVLLRTVQCTLSSARCSQVRLRHHLRRRRGTFLRSLSGALSFLLQDGWIYIECLWFLRGIHLLCPILGSIISPGRRIQGQRLRLGCQAVWRSI